MAWLRKRIGPESVIVAAAMHRDESAPHIHALFISRQDGRTS